MKQLLLLLFISNLAFAQNSELTIKEIMQGPKFVGTSPSQVYWGEHGEYLYFNWNPDQNFGDSLYRISLSNHTPQQVNWSEREALPSHRGTYNKAKSKKIYTKNGDIFLYDLKSRSENQITNTLGQETSPLFSYDETQILYLLNDNLYVWSIATGSTSQLTDFQKKAEPRDSQSSAQSEWLEKEEMGLINILAERKEKSDARKEINDAHKPQRPQTIYIKKGNVRDIHLSANGQYITYAFSTSANSTRTKVPDYVTESGFTENKNARPKVGSQTTSMTVGIYDRVRDTTYLVQSENLPGMDDSPAYLNDKDRKRSVYLHAPIWSPSGDKALLVARSKDNKDRWITLLDLSTGELKTLDRQHDDAWIAGPGIGWSSFDRTIGWLNDNKSIWFQSEETGYSHLYLLEVESNKKKALTSGSFEIYNPRLSKNQKHWYFEANKDHPGERQFYKMAVNGGKLMPLTSTIGRNDGFLSPDESKMAVLFSTASKPTELYLKNNSAGAEPEQITKSTTADFNKYQWRTPEFITFKAEDGAEVYARLYQPEQKTDKGPAVVFVHGAGYLQNAHKWWSSYYREYMFHNFLVDQGYTVLDIDYRGSAGYGRDWRTGIYQFMGGLDLSDQVDGAKHLVEAYDIDPKRIGVYGGSYGGFITLMAMFNEPDVFAAGAALRSVTDWAHYNHGYTSNILNIPVDDPEAYRKSSPIYYAEGLQGALLICHGMVDTNVHFQDVVRLSQRLIELGKDNWELAVYPMEGHGFVEPSSWTDEYSRIFKLFEDNLK